MTPGWHHYHWVNASMSKHCLRSRCLHLRCLLWFQAKIRVSLFLKDDENFLSFLGQLSLKKKINFLWSRRQQTAHLSLSVSLSLSLSGDAGFLQVSWLRKKLRADSREILGGSETEARERKGKKTGRESITAVWERERRLVNYQMCDGVRWRFLALQVWMSSMQCLMYGYRGSVWRTKELGTAKMSWDVGIWEDKKMTR